MRKTDPGHENDIPKANSAGDDALNQSIKAWLLMAWRLLVVLAWGVWWGGLCFYAVFVVPVGTSVIGSVEQGFISKMAGICF